MSSMLNMEQSRVESVCEDTHLFLMPQGASVRHAAASAYAVFAISSMYVVMKQHDTPWDHLQARLGAVQQRCTTPRGQNAVLQYSFLQLQHPTR